MRPFLNIYESILKRELDLVALLKQKDEMLKGKNYMALQMLKVQEQKIREEQQELINSIDEQLESVKVTGENINEVYKYYVLVSKFKNNTTEAFETKLYKQLMVYESQKQELLNGGNYSKKEMSRIQNQIKRIEKYKKKKLG